MFFVVNANRLLHNPTFCKAIFNSILGYFFPNVGYPFYGYEIIYYAASNCCSREVVYLGKNTILMLLCFPIKLSGCTVALSIKKITLLLCILISRLICSKIFSMMSTCSGICFTKTSRAFAFPNDYWFFHFPTISTNEESDSPSTLIFCHL